ncbi:MAG: hypothetical protein R3C49_00115 [Planctomycetaceae bacterium]
MSSVAVSSKPATEQLLLATMAGSEEPASMASLLKKISKADRPDPEAAEFAMAQLIADGSAHQFPEKQGAPQYWNHPPAEFARRKMLEKLETRLLSRREILKPIEDLKPLSGISKAEIGRIFDRLIADGIAHKHPPFLGGRSQNFSAAKVRPHDYIRDAVTKIARKLNVGNVDLAACLAELHDQLIATSSSKAAAKRGYVNTKPERDSREDSVRTAGTTPAAVSTETIRDAVLTILAELKANQFHAASYVPVYAVRRAIAARFGTEASGHNRLDDIIRQLRNEGRLRLVAITDLNVPADQLADAIPGMGQTLFYMERHA